MLKNLVILFSIFVIFGCSSNAKKADAPAAEAPKAESATPVADKAATPAAHTSATGPTVECANGKDVRNLEIKTVDKGCELAYTKNGRTESVATSANGSKHCEEVKERIQTKLEASGYSCK
jgi:hypothetical protein